MAAGLTSPTDRRGAPGDGAPSTRSRDVYSLARIAGHGVTWNPARSYMPRPASVAISSARFTPVPPHDRAERPPCMKLGHRSDDDPGPDRVSRPTYCSRCGGTAPEGGTSVVSSGSSCTSPSSKVASSEPGLPAARLAR